MECLLPGPDDGAAEEPEAQNLTEPPEGLWWLVARSRTPMHILNPIWEVHLNFVRDL